MEERKVKLLQKLIRYGCFKVGNFTLKPGITSTYYLDFIHLISHPDVLIEICHLIYEQINDTSGLICGLPYAGIPYAQTISVLYKRSSIMLRKEQKNKMIEGNYTSGSDLIIIDDIISKGTSLLESLKHFNQFNIKKIVVLVDKNQGGIENLRRQGYNIVSLFTINDFTRNL